MTDSIQHRLLDETQVDLSFRLYYNFIPGASTFVRIAQIFLDLETFQY